MPLESLQTLQDLEIAGTAGSRQDETQYETIESDEQAAQPLQPDHPSALHQASQAHPFEQPHTSAFYPPLLNPFGFDSNSTVPIDPGFLDARFDHPAAPGPGGGGVAGFHRGPWVAQPATSVNMDSFMVSPTSLPQYNPSMPLVPGMSSFEPMVSTAWSMDGSIPSTSTSRGPTMSSSLSVPGTSTPASSQSPSSPRKVSAGMVEPSAANEEAVPIHLAMQVEPRAEDQPNKKMRQTSGPKPPPKMITEKRSHRNNPPSAFTTAQIPIAPAPAAVATTGDDNKTDNGKGKDTSSNRSSTTSKHRQTSSATTATTRNAPSDPPQQPGGGPASQQPEALPAQQQQQQTQHQAQPDPRARNREAANRCRAKSKVAVAELEATERAMGAEHQALTQQARSLREEVLSLKNQLLMHGNCDDDLIQRYLANSARMVGSGVLGTTVNAGGGVPAMMHAVPGPPPPPPPPGPLMVAPASAVGSSSSSSSRAIPTALPPGAMPGAMQTLSAPGPGTTAARGHQRGGAQKQ